MDNIHFINRFCRDELCIKSKFILKLAFLLAGVECGIGFGFYFTAMLARRPYFPLPKHFTFVLFSNITSSVLPLEYYVHLLASRSVHVFNGKPLVSQLPGRAFQIRKLD